MKSISKWDMKLARQIGVVLVVKICFILAIKQIWFSHPAAQGMRMPSASVAQHLLGLSANPMPPQ
jgi:hypothetical protein